MHNIFNIFIYYDNLSIKILTLYSSFKYLNLVRSECINTKVREKKERQMRRMKKRKGIEIQKVKPLTSSQAIDVLIGNKEQNRKQKKKRKKIP